MNNQLTFLKPRGFFNLKNVSFSELENLITQQEDSYKLETVICLETVISSCYQRLEGLVDNQEMRKKCRRFERLARFREAALRRTYSLSHNNDNAVENKVYECLMQMKPPYFFLRSIIKFVKGLIVCKINIYRYFSRKDREHRDLLNNFIQDGVEEMDFLNQENRFQQRKSGDTIFNVLWKKMLHYFYYQ